MKNTIGRYTFLFQILVLVLVFAIFKEMENTDDQLSELRERKVQLEEKMHVMQQTRRHLMQQLEVLMSQLNVNF